MNLEKSRSPACILSSTGVGGAEGSERAKDAKERRSARAFARARIGEQLTWCSSCVKELEPQAMEHGQLRCQPNSYERDEVEGEESGVRVVAGVVCRYEEAGGFMRVSFELSTSS